MAVAVKNVFEFSGAGIAAAAEAVPDFADLQRLEDGEAVFEIAHGRSPLSLRVAGGRAKSETARPPVRGLRSENARQAAAAPLSAMPAGSSSVRKAGRSVDAMSIPRASGVPASTSSISAAGSRADLRYVSIGIGDAGRQPRGGTVARRLVETDAGDAFRRIEGGFERRGECRLSCRRRGRAPSARRGSRRRSRGRAPSSRGPSNWRRSAASNRRTGWRGGGRRLSITGSARSSMASCGLRVEAMHQAKRRCLALGRQCRERREAFGRRQLEPVEIERCCRGPRAAGRPGCRRDR